MSTTDFSPQNPLETYMHVAVRVILKNEDFAAFAAWSETCFWEFMPLPSEPGTLSDPADQRRVAALMTREVWNVTPLPGNGFRPKPVPEPDRNASCFCGSGRKYKQCCRSLAADLDPISITADAMWPVVLRNLPRAQVAELARNAQIPVGALVEYTLALVEEGKTREAAKLLRSTFDAPIRDTGEDAGHAFDFLCNLYDELDQPKKKMDLVSMLLEILPRSPLRSSVHQRMSVILMDAGLPEEAWNAFQLAQQDAPGDLGLPILEINLLLSAGRSGQAQERAAFWLRTLDKRGEEVSLEVEFLKKVVADPDAAMLHASHGMDRGAGSWLLEWVEETHKRPLPGYAAQEELVDAPIYDEPLHEPAAAQELQRNTDTSSTSRAQMRVHLLETPSSLARLEQRWREVFPLDAPFATHDVPFGDAFAWDESTEEAWRGFLTKHPQAADSLVILDDVVTALRQLRQSGYSWFDRLVCEPLLKRAMCIVEEAIKGTAHPRLSWLLEQNRPALRAYARSYSVYLNLDRHDRATEIARRLLELNPHDNHGFRTIVINEEIRAGKDEAAVALAEQYPDDMNPQTAYGHALALFRSGQLEAATASLRKAVVDLPRVPKYLLRESARQPKLNPGYLTFGGDDQAWSYREEMRQVWKDTPGALDWLRKVNNKAKKQG